MKIQFNSHLSTLVVVILLCPVAKAQQAMNRWTPGATIPSGQVEVCPNNTPYPHQGGYREDADFSGFCVRQIPNDDCPCQVEYISLMPDMNGKNVYLLRYTEQVSSGYYSIKLSNEAWLTATATERMTAERFSFPDASKAALLVSPKSDFEQKTLTMGQGMAECVDGSGNEHRLLYYRLYCSTPFVLNITKRLTFPELTGRCVEVRIVTADSADELKRVMDEQVWQTDFPTILDNAKNQWENALSGQVKKE